MGADSVLPGSDVLAGVEAGAELIRSESACVIGADVGATKTAVGAIDKRGAVILRREEESPSGDSQLMVSAVLDLVASSIEAARSEGFQVAACGIGAAAYVLHGEGLILEAPNVAWKMVPLQRLAAEATGLPSFLDNDANAAAAGEHLAGVCVGVDDFVYLTLGTGIGGGVFVGGKLYRGHRGTAAEFGHMTIDPHGPFCACGRRGCLEAMASGTALEREAASLAVSEPGSLLLELCGGDTAGLTGKMVSAAAERGDAAALEAFKRIGYNLGLGVVNLIHAFDPQRVVLGGGMSRSGHFLLGEVRRTVAEHGIEALVGDTDVVLSGLGADAGLIGAGAIAWEGIGCPS